MGTSRRRAQTTVGAGCKADLPGSTRLKHAGTTALLFRRVRPVLPAKGLLQRSTGRWVGPISEALPACRGFGYRIGDTNYGKLACCSAATCPRPPRRDGSCQYQRVPRQSGRDGHNQSPYLRQEVITRLSHLSVRVASKSPKGNIPKRLCRLLCGKASPFRGEEGRLSAPESQRLSAQQAAEPLFPRL